MILLIGENKQLEELIDEANFSEMGVWERTHMEEWIAEDPKILGEELLTITTEYDGFDKTNKRLDILAIDKKGKLVVIELKRDVADTFIDLQAIHYASYCSTLTLEQVAEIMSEYNGEPKEKNQDEIINFVENFDFVDIDNQPRIILVANDFKEETLAAVLWLRDSEIDITCVKLEAHKLGKKIAITPDIIIPLPEAKQFMIYREQKTKVTSQTPNEMSKFWKGILKRVRELKPEIPERRPYKSNYFPIAIEYKNIHFEWMFRKRPTERFMACLHLERKSKKENKKIFDYIVSRKDEIKQKMANEKIIFDPDWTDVWMQIFVQRNSAEFDEKNIKWGAETMVKLYETLKPILDDYFSENR